MAVFSYTPLLLLLISFLQAPWIANSQSFIGVNYGQVADNLPPPSATAKLLQSTSIQKVRLYGSDPAIIKSLANTGIGITIGTSNGDIPALASDPNFAKTWIDSNVIPFYPASKIILINVGNEVFSSGDQNLMTNLLPAMQNVQNALDAASLGGKIKVSTVHSMAVLKNSEPPSAGSFDPSYGDLIKGLLGFNSATGSPFAINPYPYFAYRDDPRPETLAFCLFQPNAGRVDGNTKIKYMNMFDAQASALTVYVSAMRADRSALQFIRQRLHSYDWRMYFICQCDVAGEVDAVHSALSSMGFKDVEIVVAETGWPYKGDSNEVGPSFENAKGYNGNLIAHLRSMVGTPLMPGKSVDTYLFALYDEDLKPGPTSERSFGLFKPDLTMTYDAGLSKTATSQTPTSSPPQQPPVTPSPTPTTPSPTPVTPSPTPNTGTWCVPKGSVSNAQLQQNLDYACGHGIDCSPIKAGGPCYEPNTVASHASYAMNLLFQSSTRNPLDCDFSQTAIISTINPSYNACNYPGGTS